MVIELHFPEAGSLKAKRQDLQSIKTQLQGRFGASVSETAHHHLWQRSTLVASLTSGSLQLLAERADHIDGWLDARCPAGVYVQRIVASIEDLRDVVSTSERGG